MKILLGFLYRPNKIQAQKNSRFFVFLPMQSIKRQQKIVKLIRYSKATLIYIATETFQCDTYQSFISIRYSMMGAFKLVFD